MFQSSHVYNSHQTIVKRKSSRTPNLNDWTGVTLKCKERKKERERKEERKKEKERKKERMKERKKEGTERLDYLQL